MSQVQRATIPALLASFIALQIAFSSCADKIKTNIIAFKALDEGLVISNITIEKNSQDLYEFIEQKKMETRTFEKANIWSPKAQLIQKLSKGIYDYIEGLKSDLKQEAGLKTSNGIESFKDSDKSAVMRLFGRKKKGEELFDRLKNYKHDLLAVDEQIEKEFNNKILLTTPAFDAATEKQDFTKIFLNDIPAAAALAMLSKFQNNIKVNENRMAIFCNYRIGGTDSWGHDFHVYSAMFVISSSYVKAGEQIEITSGIGAFSKAALPVVLINGKNVSIDADGAAHYKLKASDKPGKHTVPVEISFIDQEGKKQTITKNIDYTVAGS